MFSSQTCSSSRDIIGKYERNENSPSIEMALKIAKAFDVPVDYLLGEGKHACILLKGNRNKRIEEIEAMDDKTKSVLFNNLFVCWPIPMPFVYRRRA